MEQAWGKFGDFMSVMTTAALTSENPQEWSGRPMKCLSCHINGKWGLSSPTGLFSSNCDHLNAAKNQEVREQASRQTNQSVHQMFTEHLLWSSAV